VWTFKGNFDTGHLSRLIGVVKNKAYMIGGNGTTVISYDPATNKCSEVFESSVSLSTGLTIASKTYVVGWWASTEHKPNSFYEIKFP
jgi:hypothetical protein